MVEYGGNGSYQKLIANVYGMNKTNKALTQNYKEHSIKIRPDEIIVQQKIMSFIRSDSYSYSDGKYSNTGLTGALWGNRANTSISTHLFNFYPNYLNPLNGGHKGFGLSLRCVAK